MYGHMVSDRSSVSATGAVFCLTVNLYGRARNRTIRTEDATIPHLRTQQRVTVRTLIKPLAGIRRHRLLLHISAMRAGDDRLKNGFDGHLGNQCGGRFIFHNHINFPITIGPLTFDFFVWAHLAGKQRGGQVTICPFVVSVFRSLLRYTAQRAALRMNGKCIEPSQTKSPARGRAVLIPLRILKRSSSPRNPSSPSSPRKFPRTLGACCGSRCSKRVPIRPRTAAPCRRWSAVYRLRPC